MARGECLAGDPGEGGNFEGGGCGMVREQLPDRVDEVGLCQSRPYRRERVGRLERVRMCGAWRRMPRIQGHRGQSCCDLWAGVVHR